MLQLSWPQFLLQVFSFSEPVSLPEYSALEQPSQQVLFSLERFLLTVPPGSQCSVKKFSGQPKRKVLAVVLCRLTSEQEEYAIS